MTSAATPGAFGRAPLAQSTWTVGDRTVALQLLQSERGRPTRFVTRWAPSEPPALSSEEWRLYREGRRRALLKIAKQFGINPGVLD